METLLDLERFTTIQDYSKDAVLLLDLAENEKDPICHLPTITYLSCYPDTKDNTKTMTLRRFFISSKAHSTLLTSARLILRNNNSGQSERPCLWP